MHLERLVKCNEKKVVLVIVEGPSDEEALGAILSRYFDENEVRVYVRRGDITTEKGNKCSNIIKKVNECVKQHMALYSLRRTDYKEIIQVADLDGAFVPDSAIVEDKDAYKPNVIKLSKIKNLEFYLHIGKTLFLDEIFFSSTNKTLIFTHKYAKNA